MPLPGYSSVFLFLPSVTDSYYDSPPPLKPSILLNERFIIMAALAQGRILLNTKYPYIFLCATAYNDRRRRGGCRGTPYFRRYDRELVLKPAISVKKSWGGGAAVERLKGIVNKRPDFNPLMATYHHRSGGK